MKLNLIYLLAFLVVLTSGCFSNKGSNPTPPVPAGSFAGQFRVVRTKSGHRDTLKANINLDLSTVTGFKVYGDTSTLHAGSNGNYAVSYNNFIQFADKTFPPSGVPVKFHLQGVYQYYYDGSTFQMVANSFLDTLSLQYDLKKVN